MRKQNKEGTEQGRHAKDHSPCFCFGGQGIRLY